MLKRFKSHRHPGFTLIELLVVVVILAILAVISFVVFDGVKDRADQAKIRADIEQLKRVIMIARSNSGDKTLMEITGEAYTAWYCVIVPVTVDLSKPSQAPTCWAYYNLALENLSIAADINVRNMKDPWGRPYFIDENEGEASYCGIGMDTLAAFKHPRTSPDWSGSIDLTTRIGIPNVRPGCNGG